MLIPSEKITKRIGELFTYSSINEYIRIETPFLYPDGDIIDLFLKEAGEYITLTDLGETLGWLKMQTVAQELSLRQRQLINDICLLHGIEFYLGAFMLRLKQSDDLAEGIVRLSQAVLRVSDLRFTFRSITGISAVDEVEELLQERQISFERNPEFTGKSGRVWRPDFRIRHPRHNSLIYILSTGSRSRAQEEADRTLAAWHDLSNWKAGPEALRFISLFDDTLDVWTEEDFRLVEDVSEVTYLSRPDEFLDKLAS